MLSGLVKCPAGTVKDTPGSVPRRELNAEFFLLFSPQKQGEEEVFALDVREFAKRKGGRFLHTAPELGAPSWNRTNDLGLTNPLLCDPTWPRKDAPLSYRRFTAGADQAF